MQTILYAFFFVVVVYWSVCETIFCDHLHYIVVMNCHSLTSLPPLTSSLKCCLTCSWESAQASVLKIFPYLKNLLPAFLWPIRFCVHSHMLASYLMMCTSGPGAIFGCLLARLIFTIPESLFIHKCSFLLLNVYDVVAKWQVSNSWSFLR